MRNLFVLIAGTLGSLTLSAQTPSDALRLSWQVPGGTARQQAIGGAMGSLGGDLSATYVNPAGLGFYRTSELVVSPAFRFGTNKADYLGTQEKSSQRRGLLGASGFVFGGGQRRDGGSAAFSIAINRMADFNSNLQYRGENNQSSFSQQYLEEINNQGLRDANAVAGNFPFGTSLAFNTYWIDTVAGGSSNNFEFQSRAPIGSLLQQQTLESRGGVNELALGLAVNLRDKWLFGGTFGLPLLNYEREAEFLEADASDDVTNKFNYGLFRENLNTSGMGINLKAGLIFKPTESWRLGLAFHSPTFYNLTDVYQAEVTTDTENYQGTMTQTSEDVTGMTSEFNYLHITPYRAIASLSYVLREVEDVRQQRGFLTADVEYVNYRASSFHPDEESRFDDDTEQYLDQLNGAIDNAYKGAFNFRAGGELKFTTVMVRLGAAYYGNPYKNISGEKGHRLNLSGGLGYRNRGKFIDLTYVHALTRDVQFPYRLQSMPYAGADIRSALGQVMLTFGLKF